MWAERFLGIMRTLTMGNETKSDGSKAGAGGGWIKGWLLKFDGNSGGKWNHDGRPLMAIGTAECVQRWKDGKPIETITDQPLPDVAQLNDSVPKAEWESGRDGNLRPPWQRQYIGYLIEPETGAMFTFASGTVGGKIAVQSLATCVSNTRKLRGENAAPVYPLVTVGSKEMKTKFGVRVRPEFVIQGWRQLGEPSTPVKVIEDKTPTPTQFLNDELPW